MTNVVVKNRLHTLRTVGGMQVVGLTESANCVTVTGLFIPVVTARKQGEYNTCIVAQYTYVYMYNVYT